jgi:hypothetical protein
MSSLDGSNCIRQAAEDVVEHGNALHDDLGRQPVPGALEAPAAFSGFASRDL